MPGTAPDTVKIRRPIPKNGRSHHERTELSDRRMFDAAKTLILEVGTQKTTLKDVGERAGYSRGLANARFGSKDNLFLKLADRCREDWIVELQNAAEGKSGLDALTSRLDAIVSFAKKHPDEARVMYILWFESVGAPSAINEGLARFHDQARNDIKMLAMNSLYVDAADRETKAYLFAVQFCGTIFGLCYQWLVDPNAVDVAVTVKRIREELISQADN